MGFASVIIAFFRHCGLPAPEIEGEREVAFTVDDRAIVLREGGDGRTLVIESQAGVLGRASAFERTRLERLLRTSLALSAVRNAVAVLEEASDGEVAAVKVRSFYPYRRNDLYVLADLVADVVASADTLHGLLSAREGGGREMVTGRGDGQLMVFNP